MLVPFLHRPKVVDPDLKARLVPEYPAILRRLLDGCVRVHRTLTGGQSFHTLVPPAVFAASRCYFVEQDVMAQWLTECCVPDAAARSFLASEGLTHFVAWCDAEGCTSPAANHKLFSQEVQRAAETLGWDVRLLHLKAGTTLCGVKLRL